MKKSSYKDNFEFKQKLDYLKKTVDQHFLLTSLGFELERDSAKEYRGACIVHGGDNRTAFRFNKELGTWVCFTSKCHETFGNDIIGLIMAVKRVGFMDALKFLESLVGDIEGSISEKMKKFKMDKETDRLLSLARRQDEVPSMVNEKSLEQFKPFRSNRFIKDGFKKETLDFFEIAGGYTDSKGIIRDIIPIRNEKNKLMAYSLRDIRDDADNDFKYMITPGFNKDKVLYNLNNAKKYCSKKPLIVVEGFKGVWRLREYGIHNVVAVMGSFLTLGQQTLVSSFAAKGVVLFMDGDVPGVEGILIAYKDLKGNVTPLIPIFITDVDKKDKGLDPADLSEEQVKRYLKGCY